MGRAVIIRPMDRKQFLTYFRYSRPLHLATASLLYSLGVGIAYYLGWQIDFLLYLIGQSWITSLQLGTYFLGEYFGTPAELGLLNRRPFGKRNRITATQDKNLALYLSVLFLVFVFSLSTLLAVLGRFNLPFVFVMVFLFLGSLADVFPRINLAATEYGELLTTFLLVILTPAFGLLLITGEIHRLLAFSAFPLAVLHLAMLIMIQFPSYASNTAKNKKTLLTRLGWYQGVRLHNLLILVAFLMIGFSVLVGFSSRIALSVFLVFPFAAFQIWSLLRLAAGAPTRWKLRILNAVATFGLAAYLFAYNFWIS